MPQLIAQHLAKSYKKRQVVRDVSFQVDSGKIIGLLGPNGAGKTTCFYMLVGLIACDSGNVLYDSTDITSLPMYARARLGIGYLPQETSVFRKLSVKDNILAILELRKDLSSKERYNKLEALLHEFSIDHIQDSIGLSLSGGEKRRVEIARALAMEPKFILLDEPFAGIDPISVLDIKKIIRDLSAKNIGILITDHNVRETLSICQEAYIVSEGKIIAQGQPQTILENQMVRDVYLGNEFDL